MMAVDDNGFVVVALRWHHPGKSTCSISICVQPFQQLNGHYGHYHYYHAQLTHSISRSSVIHSRSPRHEN